MSTFPTTESPDPDPRKPGDPADQSRGERGVKLTAEEASDWLNGLVQEKHHGLLERFLIAYPDQEKKREAI
jgi:hypothetical protein